MYSENYSQKVPAKFEIFQKPYASIVLKCTVGLACREGRSPTQINFEQGVMVLSCRFAEWNVRWTSRVLLSGWES